MLNCKIGTVKSVLFGSSHACDSEGWGFIPVCSRPTNGERLISGLTLLTKIITDMR